MIQSHDFSSPRLLGEKSFKGRGPHHKTRPQFSRFKFGKKTEGLKQVDGKDLRAPHMSYPHTPSSNKTHKITPMEALYKLKDYTNGTCNYYQKQTG